MKSITSREFWGLGEDPASLEMRREGAELTLLVARVLLLLDALVLCLMWVPEQPQADLLILGTGTLAVALFGTFWLVRVGKPRLGAWLMCTGLLAADVLSMVQAGLVDVGPAASVLTVMVVAGATLGPLATAIFALLSATSVLLITSYATSGQLRAVPIRGEPWVTATGVAAAVVAVAVLMVVLFQTRVRSIYRELSTSQERDAARVAYLQAQKLEALGRMAGGIAHDFNNLLSVVRATSDILRLRGTDSKLAERVLGDLDSAIERATLMTSRLLSFSRNRTEGRPAADLAQVATDLAPLLARLVGARIEVILVGAEEPLWVSIDPTELEQVFMNLAVNARDAMPEGGHLRILLSAEDEASALIIVEDTGLGISPEVLREIFAPFFSTKRSGTGLGLATVRDIVEGAGGTIEVASQVNEGTTFSISLRRTSPSPAKRGASPALDLPSVPGRVLLVEDHDLARRATAQLLEGLGFEVVAVTNGVEALALIDAAVTFDVLLTDKVMPRMGGLELIARVRERGLACPIIVMSGDGILPEGGEGHKGAAAHLAKPFSMAALTRALSDALGNLPPALGVGRGAQGASGVSGGPTRH
jgi:signal transduction histidine kinase